MCNNELKNAKDRVTFIEYDDWNRALFKSNKLHIIIVDVDGELHSITDSGEPCTLLDMQHQKFHNSSSSPFVGCCPLPWMGDNGGFESLPGGH